MEGSDYVIFQLLGISIIAGLSFLTGFYIGDIKRENRESKLLASLSYREKFNKPTNNKYWGNN